MIDVLTMRKPRPGTGRGRGACGALLAVLSRPRPEQREAFTALIVEQVRVDWCIEGGVVELEREVVAAFLGALGPSGADLSPAHVDAMAGSVLVGAIGFCDDADALGLQTEGDDLALEIVADLLERTDGSHVTSPVVFRARDHRGLDGDLQGRGRSATHLQGRSEAEDAVVATFLSCEEWALAQGKKVVSDGVASQTIEAQPVFGQIKPSQRPGASRAETQSWEKRWLISVRLHKRSERSGEEKETQCGKWRNRRRGRPPRATSLHVYAELN